MERRVMLILVNSRKDTSETVQKILSGWGCHIKTRLGLHDDTLENCSESGLIFLELKGDPDKLNELERKLNLVNGVNAKQVVMTDK
jgi:hypothetical protein